MTLASSYLSMSVLGDAPSGTTPISSYLGAFACISLTNSYLAAIAKGQPGNIYDSYLRFLINSTYLRAESPYIDNFYYEIYYVSYANRVKVAFPYLLGPSAGTELLSTTGLTLYTNNTSKIIYLNPSGYYVAKSNVGVSGIVSIYTDSALPIASIHSVEVDYDGTGALVDISGNSVSAFNVSWADPTYGVPISTGNYMGAYCYADILSGYLNAHSYTIRYINL